MQDVRELTLQLDVSSSRKIRHIASKVDPKRNGHEAEGRYGGEGERNVGHSGGGNLRIARVGSVYGPKTARSTE